MPVILAIHEAEIRRMAVQGQPWANSLRPHLENTHHNVKYIALLYDAVVAVLYQNCF
jgi:hypothetical protein